MASEKRLIDANWILGEIEHDVGCYEIGKLTEDDALYVDLRDVVKMVCAAPTVDAVEVVHARWNPIRNFGGGECYGYCTNCKTYVKADNATGLVMSNRFCHWCGAKMDGADEE